MTALQVLAQATTQTSVAEAVTFWVLAPVAVAAAVAMVLSTKAVHAALLLVLDLFCLAVFYAAQDAPFLAAVQIVVYAGAIMVLFLFVLMLVGVDRSDSLVETLRGQRIAALLAGLGFAGLLGTALSRVVLDRGALGLTDANQNGNVYGIAKLLFGDYVLAFEVTSALLIVAAIGTMVLTHKPRTTARPSQRELSEQRFAGTHPVPTGPSGPSGGEAP